MWVTLEGRGPWTFRIPAGGVFLDVRSRDGMRPDAYALVDGELHHTAGRPLEIHGLADGWHRMLVAAEGHWAKEYRFRIRDGDVRDFLVWLNPFP